ncbi:cyclase family protein [Yaniella flava]|uniref:Cyclase family protein n=1 Tax=Yaniella flava TaxID=287930 RepID=A0ABP5G724_9MICC|nr:cyclase family protein [Micrococcaceae bacterium]
MTLLDLSHPLRTGMPVYPCDPQVSTTAALKLEDDGAAVTHLQFGTHSGTHLDAPAHTVPHGRTVDQLDLERLVGAAYVLQVRTEHTAGIAAQVIRHEDVDPLPEELPGIVCIATGWDQYFYEELREQHPFIAPELAHELWQRGARVLGVDTLSPDPTSDEAHQVPVHDFWLGNDGVIVENLRRLTVLPQQVWMSVLPLNVEGLDGSPVRAVARPL